MGLFFEGVVSSQRFLRLHSEWLTAGGQPVADSTAQKTAREKAFGDT